MGCLAFFNAFPLLSILLLAGVGWLAWQLLVQSISEVGMTSGWVLQHSLQIDLTGLGGIFGITIVNAVLVSACTMCLERSLRGCLRSSLLSGAHRQRLKASRSESGKRKRGGRPASLLAGGEPSVSKDEEGAAGLGAATPQQQPSQAELERDVKCATHLLSAVDFYGHEAVLALALAVLVPFGLACLLSLLSFFLQNAPPAPIYAHNNTEIGWFSLWSGLVAAVGAGPPRLGTIRPSVGWQATAGYNGEALAPRFFPLAQASLAAGMAGTPWPVLGAEGAWSSTDCTQLDSMGSPGSIHPLCIPESEGVNFSVLLPAISGRYSNVSALVDRAIVVAADTQAAFTRADAADNRGQGGRFLAAGSGDGEPLTLSWERIDELQALDRATAIVSNDSTEVFALVQSCVAPEHSAALMRRIQVAGSSCLSDPEMSLFESDQAWAACSLQRLAMTGPLPSPGLCQHLRDRLRPAIWRQGSQHSSSDLLALSTHQLVPAAVIASASHRNNRLPSAMLNPSRAELILDLLRASAAGSSDASHARQQLAPAFQDNLAQFTTLFGGRRAADRQNSLIQVVLQALPVVAVLLAVAAAFALANCDLTRRHDSATMRTDGKSFVDHLSELVAAQDRRMGISASCGAAALVILLVSPALAGTDAVQDNVLIRFMKLVPLLVALGVLAGVTSAVGYGVICAPRTGNPSTGLWVLLQLGLAGMFACTLISTTDSVAPFWVDPIWFGLICCVCYPVQTLLLGLLTWSLMGPVISTLRQRITEAERVRRAAAPKEYDTRVKYGLDGKCMEDDRGQAANDGNSRLKAIMENALAHNSIQEARVGQSECAVWTTRTCSWFRWGCVSCLYQSIPACGLLERVCIVGCRSPAAVDHDSAPVLARDTRALALEVGLTALLSSVVSVWGLRCGQLLRRHALVHTMGASMGASMGMPVAMQSFIAMIPAVAVAVIIAYVVVWRIGKSLSGLLTRLLAAAWFADRGLSLDMDSLLHIFPLQQQQQLTVLLRLTIARFLLDSGTITRAEVAEAQRLATTQELATDSRPGEPAALQPVPEGLEESDTDDDDDNEDDAAGGAAASGGLPLRAVRSHASSSSPLRAVRSHASSSSPLRAVRSHASSSPDDSGADPDDDDSGTEDMAELLKALERGTSEHQTDKRSKKHDGQSDRSDGHSQSSISSTVASLVDDANIRGLDMNVEVAIDEAVKAATAPGVLALAGNTWLSMSMPIRSINQMLHWFGFPVDLEPEQHLLSHGAHSGASSFTAPSMRRGRSVGLARWSSSNSEISSDGTAMGGGRAGGRLSSGYTASSGRAPNTLLRWMGATIEVAVPGAHPVGLGLGSESETSDAGTEDMLSADEPTMTVLAPWLVSQASMIASQYQDGDILAKSLGWTTIAMCWLQLGKEISEKPSLTCNCAFLTRFRVHSEYSSLSQARIEVAMTSRRVCCGACPVPSICRRKTTLASAKLFQLVPTSTNNTAGVGRTAFTAQGWQGVARHSTREGDAIRAMTAATRQTNIPGDRSSSAWQKKHDRVAQKAFRGSTSGSPAELRRAVMVEARLSRIGMARSTEALKRVCGAAGIDLGLFGFGLSGGHDGRGRANNQQPGPRNQVDHQGGRPAPGHTLSAWTDTSTGLFKVVVDKISTMATVPAVVSSLLKLATIASGVNSAVHGSIIDGALGLFYNHGADDDDIDDVGGGGGYAGHGGEAPSSSSSSADSDEAWLRRAVRAPNMGPRIGGLAGARGSEDVLDFESRICKEIQWQGSTPWVQGHLKHYLQLHDLDAQLARELVPGGSIRGLDAAKLEHIMRRRQEMVQKRLESLLSVLDVPATGFTHAAILKKRVRDFAQAAKGSALGPVAQKLLQTRAEDAKNDALDDDDRPDSFMYGRAGRRWGQQNQVGRDGAAAEWIEASATFERLIAMSLAVPSRLAENPDDVVESWDDNWQNPAEDPATKAAHWANDSAHGSTRWDAVVFVENALAYMQTLLVVFVSSWFVYLFGNPEIDTGFQLFFETAIVGMELARAQLGEMLAVLPFAGIVAPTPGQIQALKEKEEALLQKYKSRGAQAAAGHVLPGNALGARSGSGFEVAIVIEAPATVDSGYAWGFHGAIRIPILVSDAGEFSGHLAKLVPTTDEKISDIIRSIHSVEAGRRLSLLDHALQTATNARHNTLHKLNTAVRQLRELQSSQLRHLEAGPPRTAALIRGDALEAGPPRTASVGPVRLCTLPAQTTLSVPPTAEEVAAATCPELRSLRLVSTAPPVKTLVGTCIVAVYMRLRKMQLESLSACRGPGAVASIWALMAEREVSLLQGAHGEPGIESATRKISALLQQSQHGSFQEMAGHMAEIVCEEASDPFTAFARLYVAEETIRAHQELEEARAMQTNQQATEEASSLFDTDATDMEQHGSYAPTASAEQSAPAPAAPAPAPAAPAEPTAATQVTTGLLALATDATEPALRWVGNVFKLIHSLFGGVNDTVQECIAISNWIAAEVATEMGVSPIRVSAAEGWARWVAAHKTSCMLLLELFGREVDARLGASTRALFAHRTESYEHVASTAANDEITAASEHMAAVAPIDIGAELLDSWAGKVSICDTRHPSSLPDACRVHPIDNPPTGANAVAKASLDWRVEAAQRKNERMTGRSSASSSAPPARAEQRARYHLHMAANTLKLRTSYDEDLQRALDVSERAQMDLEAHEQAIESLEAKLAQSCRQPQDFPDTSLVEASDRAAAAGTALLPRVESAGLPRPAICVVAGGQSDRAQHKPSSRAMRSQQRSQVVALLEAMRSEEQDAAYDAAHGTQWLLRPLMDDETAVSDAVIRGWNMTREEPDRKARNLKYAGSRVLKLSQDLPASSSKRDFHAVNADADMECLRPMLRTRHVAAAVKDAAAHATKTTQLRTSTLAFLPQMLWRGFVTGATALLVHPSARRHLDDAIANSVAASSPSTASEGEATKALESGDSLVLESAIAQSPPAPSLRRRRHASGHGPT